MKKLLYLPIIFIGWAVFSQSCDTSKVLLTEVDSAKIEQTYTVKVGDTLQIVMTSNASTGYKWEDASKIKPKVVRFIDRKYKQDERNANMIGSAGLDVWTYVATKPGELFLWYKYVKHSSEEYEIEKYYKVIVE